MKDIEAKKVDLNDEVMANVVGGAGEQPTVSGAFFYDGYWYVVADPQPSELGNYKWCYRIEDNKVSWKIIQIPNNMIPKK